MSNFVLSLTTFFAYSAFAFIFWRAQMAGNAEKLNQGWLGHTVGVPLALHAWLLYEHLFIGGSLNVTLNCIDRHLPKRASQTAIAPAPRWHQA